MTTEELLTILQGTFTDAIVGSKLSALQPWIQIAPNRTKEIGIFLRDEPSLQFNYLSCLSGVDYGNGMFGVVYHVNSTVLKHSIVLKVLIPRDNPHVQSVSAVWRTADWHEREAYDMFGIIFDEHPDLRRILLPDDWDGYPLRKDYQVQEFYHGIKVPY
ncbi:MAG: NADH-quinone oxidoreductase subunit C [Bacteroidetes bacterium]|nr:NADH-quinone oxidoreductase subunit C [Bacteroidota bacterium]